MLADELAISAAGRTARRSSSRSSSARRRVARRQDLLVVRELAVDQARDEVDPVEVEQDLVAGLGEHELHGVVGVGEDPASSSSARAGMTTEAASTGSRMSIVRTAIR